MLFRDGSQSHIPTGLCQCGCGGQTAFPAKTDRKAGKVAGVPNRFLRGHGRRRTGVDHPAWVGGRVILSGGYVGIYMPERAYANSHGYVFEHRLIAEGALGKRLPKGALVHHVDENRQNNSNDNLVVCQDGAYHKLLHQRMDALRACGDPSAIRCTICSGYDRQDDISVVHRRTRKGEQVTYHRTCMRDKARLAYSQRTNLAPHRLDAAV